MGRTKTAGILRSGTGYEVDKVHKGIRLRQRGFDSFESAERWLIDSVVLINRDRDVGQRVQRTFEEAAVHYLQMFSDKASLESEVYHLKAVMPFIGTMDLEQVHNGTLKSFVQARKNAGRKNKTINLSLSIVRRILNLAARDWRDDSGKPWLLTAPLITMLPLTDARPPKPIMWPEQRRLLPALPDHLAEMALFCLNTGARDEVICNLQWDWEVPVPQLGVSIFIVPPGSVKGEEGKKTEKVLVCNSVAHSIIERQRGKHETHVFAYRRERVKNVTTEPTMAYHPIKRMSNSGWCTGRKKAGLGDLHVHDLRHTVGLRLREAGVAEQTVSDILWHSTKSMTAHYSMAQIVEVFGALEKIKDEVNRWNISLASLVSEANQKRLTQKSPTQRKTG